ncbi:MAG: dihydrolipoyl dehydrogenase [Oscillospiraceae bacterium]|nr:dihydrolipoyl dehydrogenase [Oscillospiraceae bacterium]
MNDYDLIVLGGGPGGYMAAIRAAKRDKKTLLIEPGELGGTCLNRGCVPVKALLHSAALYRDILNAGRYGINVDGASYDYATIAQRKDGVVRRMRGGLASLIRSAGISVLNARGELAGSNEVVAGGVTYAANNIVLATGAVPAIPNIPGAGVKNVLTSDGVISLTSAPKSVVIVGGGVIGMEFASLFAMLGIAVTVLEALPDVLSGFDRDMVKPVERSLAQNGAIIRAGARVLSFTEADGALATRYVLRDGQEEITASSDIVILAVGRSPATAGIGLERAGVRTDEKGFIPVGDDFMTNVPGVYAVGDVIGRQQLAHAAMAQGAAVADAICGVRQNVKLHTIPSCVYTSPEIAMVGMTERQAIETGRNVKIGVFPAAANARSVIIGESGGSAKIIADAETGEILGAHICAPGATELIAGPAAAMNAEATVEELANTVHPHPTVSEIVMEAALDAIGLCCHK